MDIKPFAIAMVVFAIAPRTAKAQAEFSARLSAHNAVADSIAGAPWSTLDFAAQLTTPETDFGLSSVLLLDLERHAEQSSGIHDNSSFLRVRWRPTSWGPREGASATVLPISSRRLHLGHEQPATWGRTAISKRARHWSAPQVGIEPALELRLERNRWYGFGAARYTRMGVEAMDQVVPDKLQRELQESVWTWMAGAGVGVLAHVRIDVAAALAGHASGQLASEGRPEVQTTAFSGRILFQHGGAIEPSVNLELHRTDPRRFELSKLPESGEFAASLSLETIHLVHMRRPAASAPPMVDRIGDPATLCALQGRIRTGVLHAHLLGLYRTALFGLDQVLTPAEYSELATHAETRAEWKLLAGAEVRIPSRRVVPGFMLGMSVPGQVIPWGNAFEGQDFPASGSLIGAGDRSLLLTAKGNVRVDPVDAFTAVGEVTWSHWRTTSDLGIELLLQLRI